MPSRRPRTSCAPDALLDHTPACISRFLSVKRRVRAMISAITSSTTERVLENGALKTVIPLRVAAGRSIWLVPIQKAPTASRWLALSRTASVTWVRERIPSRAVLPSASRPASSFSSRARGSVSTSNPASPRMSAAPGWMFSKRSARRRGGRSSVMTGAIVEAARSYPAEARRLRIKWRVWAVATLGWGAEGWGGGGGGRGGGGGGGGFRGRGARAGERGRRGLGSWGGEGWGAGEA